jgi:hypothetical protein
MTINPQQTKSFDTDMIEKGPLLDGFNTRITAIGVDNRSEIENDISNNEEAPEYVPEIHSSDDEVTVHGSFAEDKKISPVSAVFNVINTIIGAGILGKFTKNAFFSLRKHIF